MWQVACGKWHVASGMFFKPSYSSPLLKTWRPVVFYRWIYTRLFKSILKTIQWLWFTRFLGADQWCGLKCRLSRRTGAAGWWCLTCRLLVRSHMKSSSSWKSRGCLIDFDSLKGIQTGLKQRNLSASPFPRLFAATPTRVYSWTGRYPYFRPSRLIVGNGPGRVDQENHVIQLQILIFSTLRS